MNRKVTDGINFIAKLNASRVLNMGKLVGSYYWSRLAGRSYHRGLPASISIEPTTSCNLRCPECPSGLRSFTRPIGMLKTSQFESILAQVAPSLSYLIFYFQGEPYLNPSFLDMVQKARVHHVYTATSTNGHYLTDASARRTVESGLDRLIISLDGTTQETYQAYRVGGNLEKVMEGTRNIVRWKKQLKSRTPHVVFQFLVVRPNEHQIPDVEKLAVQLGVDEVAFKTAQIYDFENGSDLIPAQDRYARYRKNGDGTYSVKNELSDNCWKMWHSCVITWDGKVVPCCFDKDAHYVMGDLNRNSFHEIWNGKAYDDFRNMLLRSRSNIEMCRNCTAGTRVWA